MDIIFATHNPHKVEEVQRILADSGILVRSLDEIGFDEEIIEDGKTLDENAWIKANIIFDKTQLNVMADDTGLEVMVLDNAPGVYSARYAGPGKDSEANMSKLLKELEDKCNRKARFRTVVACICNGHRFECEGIVTGKIIRERQGTGGFGYDPIFQPEGYDKTFGELSSEIKNEMSHRARAFQNLKNHLSK